MDQNLLALMLLLFTFISALCPNCTSVQRQDAKVVNDKGLLPASWTGVPLLFSQLSRPSPTSYHTPVLVGFHSLPHL